MRNAVPPMFHDGNRSLQDQFDSRRIADRLESVRMRAEFTESDISIIHSAPCFFLATANAEGWPDCSYKGGMPGFVQVVSQNSLLFPDYDGNGMFKSLGNIMANAAVGLLFIELDGERRRIRVNGTAVVISDPELVRSIPGAKLIVRVTAHHIFPNCPRYIHQMPVQEVSDFAPRPDHTPPEPFWKSKPDLRDYLPGKSVNPPATVE